MLWQLIVWFWVDWAAASFDYAWSQFGHDVYNSRFQQFTIINRHTAPRLSVLWNFTGDDGIETNPVIKDQIAYVASSNYLYALDTSQNQVIWSRNQTTQSTPVIVEDLLIFSPKGNTLRAVDRYSGYDVWTINLDSNSTPGIIQAGIHLNGRVYFRLATKYPSSVQKVGSIYAIDAATGLIYWSSRGLILNPIWGSGISILESEGLIYTTFNRTVLALNLDTGATYWKYISNSTELRSPMIVTNPNLVIVGSDTGLILALNATTGAQVWKSSSVVGCASISSYSANQDSIFVTLARFRKKKCIGGWMALNKANGTTKWIASVPEASGPVSSTYDLVIGTKFNGTLVILDADNGQTLYTKQVSRNTSTAGLVLTGNKLYFNAGRTLYAFGYDWDLPMTQLEVVAPGYNDRDEL